MTVRDRGKLGRFHVQVFLTVKIFILESHRRDPHHAPAALAVIDRTVNKITRMIHLRALLQSINAGVSRCSSEIQFRYIQQPGETAPAAFSLKEVGKAFVDAIWALLAPIIILGGIYSGLFTPTEASGVCCFYCLIVGLFIYKETKWSDVPKLVYSGVKNAAGIMLIVAATQVFGWVITRMRIPQTIAAMFTGNISSPTVFMLAVCLILLVAGCFIDAVPALLIFAPIFVPTAQAYGINLIYFGVIMVVVLCIGLATPPVGINLYVSSAVGGQPVHKIIPHLPIPLATIAVGTLILIFFPAIITLLPGA